MGLRVRVEEKERHLKKVKDAQVGVWAQASPQSPREGKQ